MIESTLAKIESKPEVKTLSANAEKALAYAEKIEIVDEATKEKATKAVIQIRDQETAGDKMRKFFTEPLNAQVKNINNLFMPTVKIFNQAQTIIREKLGAYQMEQERIAIAARAKVEKELAEGKIKKVETAVKKMGNIVEPEKTQRTEAGTTTYRDVAEVTIIDENLIPREYCTPDPKKYEVIALARHKSKMEQIPGLKVEIKKVPSFRKNGF